MNTHPISIEHKLDAAVAWMPPRSPLAMPAQDFDQPFTDPNAPGVKRNPMDWVKRALIGGPALVLTGAMIGVFYSWQSADGFNLIESVWLFLVGVTFFWITLVVAHTVAGLAREFITQKPQIDGISPLNVAVLVPIYNESPIHVFGNVKAMIDDLTGQSSDHEFTFFILSDTQDEAIALQEERAMGMVAEQGRLFYRRRHNNADRKTGNLRDWITNWGGGYDAMLVLDADSVMSQHGMVGLADALGSDPTLALVQSNPKHFGAHSLFGRLQQFAGAAFGHLPAEGLAFWSVREGNYIGHNAIMRVRAFADCAGLPYLPARGGKHTLIYSHDFVEAALLRRAGWGVRIVPEVTDSFEEIPITLIDYILRDRRWCQGNMQHLRILWRKGFHPVSRFHMGHNALSYLMSPAWFALVLIWISASLVAYSTPQLTPEAGGQVGQSFLTQGTVWMLAFVYVLLLAPKFAGAALVLSDPEQRKGFGGTWRFCGSFAMEVIGSIAVAPVMMIQQTIAIIRICLGRHESWGLQKRYQTGYSLPDMLRFHRVETAFGLVLMVGIASGMITLWLLPIGVSLLLAVPMSAISGLNLRRKNGTVALMTAQDLKLPEILQSAFIQRDKLAEMLARPEPVPMAAE